jgi:hypothetical protein
VTNYIVFGKDPTANKFWAIIGHARATGPVQARKAVANAAGEYLMVPVRNATFESVSVEQPPPKETSVRVAAAHYLDFQPELPVEDVLADNDTHNVKA